MPSSQRGSIILLPLILSSSSLLLVTAPSNSKTFPPSYYALPFNLLFSSHSTVENKFTKNFFHLPRIFQQWDPPFICGLWPNCCSLSGCSSRFLPNATVVLHNFSPGHKPLLPVQPPSARTSNNGTSRQTQRSVSRTTA